ncbi:winged helix-turn-helix domain-containing protein [Actinokineospora sp. UTMC 2448]|uniref:GntR family transcriptional regulator n=1 Tax=Actinokineospora sp. UTMC 2448 TaxID=2268449 RepID=UPI0021643C2A|nr:winged helix-turn-helix domain-containing protein [Actinokineospora sp. UTMC 2448]
MDREIGDVRPEYVLLAEILREKITSGQLALGSLVPSHKILADTYGTSQATAQRAVGLLRDEGFVAGASGRGTFVVASTPVHQRGDAMVMLTEVHQRLDELEQMVASLKAVVDTPGATRRQPRSNRA